MRLSNWSTLSPHHLMERDDNERSSFRTCTSATVPVPINAVERREVFALGARPSNSPRMTPITTSPATKPIAPPRAAAGAPQASARASLSQAPSRNGPYALSSEFRGHHTRVPEFRSSGVSMPLECHAGSVTISRLVRTAQELSHVQYRRWESNPYRRSRPDVPRWCTIDRVGNCSEHFLNLVAHLNNELIP
jgi:hypothetical protein